MELSIKQRIGLELERMLRKQEIKEKKLRQLFWECTLRCNLNCRHCGSSCLPQSAFKDMPKEDFLKVIDSILPHVDNHHTLIILTGGEPLLRKDIEEVGLELYKREFPWSVVSNGMLMTEQKLTGLLRSGLRAATISLDGNEADHNYMRQNKESFQRAFNAIKLLGRTTDINWDVATCVTPNSLKGLAELRDRLWEVGVRNWRVFTAFPNGRAGDNPDIQLNSNEFHELMHFIAENRRNGYHISYSCEGFLGRYEGIVRDHLFSCQAGISVSAILNDGTISSCPGIRDKYAQGNIYKDDFWDVWTNGYQPHRNREWARTGKCADCRFFRFCGGSGMHLRNGDGSLMLCHMDRIAGGK